MSSEFDLYNYLKMYIQARREGGGYPTNMFETLFYLKNCGFYNFFPKLLVFMGGQVGLVLFNIESSDFRPPFWGPLAGPDTALLVLVLCPTL